MALTSREHNRRYRAKKKAAGGPTEEERAARRAWDRANAESINARKRAKYEADRDRELERMRRWRTENPDAHHASQQNWYAENRNYAVQAMRESRAESPEKHRAWDKKWRDSNPLKVREKCQERRRRLVGAPGEGVTADQFDRLCESFRRRCAYCGLQADLTLDHVHPLSRGGAHDLENALPACQTCNSSKGSRTILEWVLWKESW